VFLVLPVVPFSQMKTIVFVRPEKRPGAPVEAPGIEYHSITTIPGSTVQPALLQESAVVNSARFLSGVSHVN
jgi:hypothetical protein